jgi:hypothetical protein
MLVNIELRKLNRQVEKSLLADLQEVCPVIERRAYGLTYECETDKSEKIMEILARYRKSGFEIVHQYDGDHEVFTVEQQTNSKLVDEFIDS